MDFNDTTEGACHRSEGHNQTFRRLSNDNHQDIKQADNCQELEKLFANHERLMFLRAASCIGFFTDVCAQNHLENYAVAWTSQNWISSAIPSYR